MTPLSGRRGQQALIAGYRLWSDINANRALKVGAVGTTHGDQLVAEMFAKLADRYAAKARRLKAKRARSVARPPSRRAR